MPWQIREIKMRSSELNVSKFKVLVEALEALPEDIRNNEVDMSSVDEPTCGHFSGDLLSHHDSIYLRGFYQMPWQIQTCANHKGCPKF
jgi:hypothetical protein